MFIVTGTQKEVAPDRYHMHIKAVCVRTGQSYTRAQVVASIATGEKWYTLGKDGTYAEIKLLGKCPVAGCTEVPYLTTRPDHSTANNLDNLGPC